MCVLHLTPYTLHPTPCISHPSTLHSSPCTLRPTPCTKPFPVSLLILLMPLLHRALLLSSAERIGRRQRASASTNHPTPDHPTPYTQPPPYTQTPYTLHPTISYFLLILLMRSWRRANLLTAAERSGADVSAPSPHTLHPAPFTRFPTP